MSWSGDAAAAVALPAAAALYTRREAETGNGSQLSARSLSTSV